jgi:hypothetical protein
MAARHPSLMAEDELAELLAEQVTYYRARAEEYDATYPLDDGADVEARARLVAALEALAPPREGARAGVAAPGSGRRSSPATHAP